MMNIRNIVDSFYKMVNDQQKHNESLDILKTQIGNLQARELKNNPATSFSDAEFKVFSQYGDDGLIQFLIQNIAISNKTFIEFGVENYTEANTRFLLINDNWKGLVIDGGENNIQQIKNQTIYWRHDLTAVCSFITKENINQLFIENGFEGEIGILSVDIDGNDYWVWENINCVSPDIVIAEYNSNFGPIQPVSVPYNSSFYRTNAHYSNLFWGCSLNALCYLAEKKGYDHIGCNNAGNNAYFIKKEKRPSSIPKLTSEESFVEAKFRESRDQQGKLNYLSGKQKIKAIQDCIVTNVTDLKAYKIKDLYNL